MYLRKLNDKNNKIRIEFLLMKHFQSFMEE